MIRNKEFHSPPIYSCGYKFGFSIRFNNHEHLGMNFSLLKGENDDRLNWPLKGEMTFLLVNQTFGSVYDHEGTISSEHYPGWFNTPTIDDDPSHYRFPHFISHEDLNASGYIINNTILLRVLLKCV